MPTTRRPRNRPSAPLWRLAPRAAACVLSGCASLGRDPALRLAPQFITILDAEHCLVLAGDVQAGLIRWCAPVDSDSEARCVVTDACGLRAAARAATARATAAADSAMAA